MAITPRLLSQSTIFQNAQAANASALAAAVAGINAALPASINTVLSALPNEASGTPRPSTGAYISGDGVVKVVISG